jgi:hypothetical protein
VLRLSKMEILNPWPRATVRSLALGRAGRTLVRPYILWRNISVEAL